MPTPASPAPAIALDAWFSALVVGQPGVTASGTPEGAPAAPASTTPPAPAGNQPDLPGMPQDAANTPANAGATSVPGAQGSGGQQQAARGPDLMFMLWIGVIMVVVMVLTSTRAGKKERKKREELMASLRRGDRVQTIGGMIGKVVELRDDEVVLEGENPGSKFRFARSAVQQVIRASDSPASTSPEVEVKAGKEGSKV